MNLSAAPLWFQALLPASIFAYLGAMYYVPYYLYKFHRDAWVHLGSPTVTNLGVLNSLRLMRLVFIPGFQPNVADWHLTCLLWTARTLGLLALYVIVFAKNWF